MSPRGPNSRRVLNQSTHVKVANSTASRVRHGPFRRITSVLYKPIVSQQVLVGVNYALTDGLSVGVKGRWVRAGSFESDEAVVWDPLRSHVPNLRRDGSEPVSGQLLTDASTPWGVGLSLTYHF